MENNGRSLYQSNFDVADLEFFTSADSNHLQAALESNPLIQNFGNGYTTGVEGRLHTFAHLYAMKALKFTPQSVISYERVRFENEGVLVEETLTLSKLIDIALNSHSIPFYLIHATDMQEDFVMGRNPLQNPLLLSKERPRFIREKLVSV